MNEELKALLADVAKFLEKMYAMGYSHTEAQELLTRVRNAKAQS